MFDFFIFRVMLKKNLQTTALAKVNLNQTQNLVCEKNNFFENILQKQALPVYIGRETDLKTNLKIPV